MYLRILSRLLAVATPVAGVLLLLVPTFCYSQEKPLSQMQEGYYVVVGAYAPAKEYHARQYVKAVNKLGYEADYGFSSKKNLYFVYVDYSQNFHSSIAEMQHTRKIEQFHDAWVFVCSADDGQTMSEAETKRADNTIKALKEGVGQLDQVYKERFDAANDNSIEENEDIATEGIAEGGEDALKNSEEKADDTSVKHANALDHFSIFFNLVNARNNKDVDGEIQVIDTERSSLLTSVKSGSYITLPDPGNGTGKITLICDVFGYRKTQKEINYYSPLQDTTSSDIDVMSDIYLVNFDLIRYHIGDIVTMYNVYYYKDAAVMRPESKYEINSLLEMMNENPDYRIKIHGHTNGRRPGKIITKKEDGQYFALASDNIEESFGTARQLSKKRAETIRDYLVDHGVAPDRLEIKAWGGRRMLYDKMSSKAQRNVRVEIEILQE